MKAICKVSCSVLRGSSLRGSSFGKTMTRTAALRALVLTAAFAAALTPFPCLGQSPDPNSTAAPANTPDKPADKPAPKAPPKLPAKATKPLPPELLTLLRQKQMPLSSPILVRTFKEE